MRIGCLERRVLRQRGLKQPLAARTAAGEWWHGDPYLGDGSANARQRECLRSPRGYNRSQFRCFYLLALASVRMKLSRR